MSKTKISTVRLPINVAMDVYVRHQDGENPIDIAIKALSHRLEAVGAPDETILDVQIVEYVPLRCVVEENVSNGICNKALILDTEDDSDADDEVDDRPLTPRNAEFGDCQETQIMGGVP